MKCDRHMWDTLTDGFCWKCEELTIKENKRKYEDKFRDNSLQGTTRDNEISSISTRKQKN